MPLQSPHFTQPARNSRLVVLVLLAGIVFIEGRSIASAQARDPIKVFVTAQPPAGDDEKAKKEAKNVADTTDDVQVALKRAAKDQIVLVDAADQADVAIAITGRRQAAIGPKIIMYTMRIGRANPALDWKQAGGVWYTTAQGFAGELVGWAGPRHDDIKTVAARRGTAGGGDTELVDLLDSFFSQAVGFAVKGLKDMGTPGLSAGVPPLLKLLTDKNDFDRRMAAGALKDLTGQKFGNDRVKWEQWWASHPAAAAKQER